MMLNKVDANNMTKTVIDTLVEVTNTEAGKLGIKIDEVKSLSEDEVDDNATVKNKLSEIEALLQSMKAAQDEEHVVIKSWFEE